MKTFLLIFWLICIVANFFFTVGLLKTSCDEDTAPTFIVMVFTLDIFLAPAIVVLFVSNLIWDIILKVKTTLRKNKKEKK